MLLTDVLASPKTSLPEGPVMVLTVALERIAAMEGTLGRPKAIVMSEQARSERNLRVFITK